MYTDLRLTEFKAEVESKRLCKKFFKYSFSSFFFFWLSRNEARFKRRATAVLNTTDRIKFDFSTAVARRLKPSVSAGSWTWSQMSCDRRAELDS